MQHRNSNRAILRPLNMVLSKERNARCCVASLRSLTFEDRAVLTSDLVLYFASLARYVNQLRAAEARTIVEPPTVTPFTRSFVAGSPARDRIQVESLDVPRQRPTGKFDGAILDAFVQVLTPDDARQSPINIGKAIMLVGRAEKRHTKGSYGWSDKPIVKLAADQCVRMTHEHLHQSPAKTRIANGQEQEE